MGTFTSISYTELFNLAEQLAGKAESMKDLLDLSVKPQMNKIGTDEVWSGDAADQARAEFDALSGKFGLFYTAVKDCSNYLKKVAETYKATDAAAQKAIGR